MVNELGVSWAIHQLATMENFEHVNEAQIQSRIEEDHMLILHLEVDVKDLYQVILEPEYLILQFILSDKGFIQGLL